MVKLLSKAMWGPGVNLQTITCALTGRRNFVFPKGSIYGLWKSTVYALDRRHGEKHCCSQESSRGAKNCNM